MSRFYVHGFSAKQVLVGLLCLIGLQSGIVPAALGQSAVLEAAPPVPRIGEEHISGTVHVDGKAAYLLKERGSTRLIQKLNLATLAVEREDTVRLTGHVMQPDRFDILDGLDIVQLEGEDETLYCFATGFEEESTQPQLYVQKRSLEGKILQDWTFVGEGDAKLGMANHASFVVRAEGTPGKEFVAYYLAKLQGVLYLQVFVMDKHFTLKDSKLVNLALNLDEFKPLSIRRYQDKLYMLARLTWQAASAVGGSGALQHTLFQVDLKGAEGQEPARIELTDDRQLITDYGYTWDLEKGRFYLVGGLTRKNPLYTDRLFHQSVDLNKFAIEHLETYTFADKDVRSLFVGFKPDRQANDFTGFRITDLLRKADGSLDLVFDSFLLQPGTTRPFLSRGVNVAHFDPKGKVEWLGYAARNAGGSSTLPINDFYSCYYDGKVRVVYVGGHRDLDEPALGGMNMVRRPHYYSATFDEQGQVKQEDLGPVSDRKDMLAATDVLASTVRISHSEVLWYVYEKKKMQYGRLLLK